MRGHEGMKKLVLLFAAVLCVSFNALAQSELNDKAESIAGIYKVVHEGENTKVAVTMDTDGTFTAQVIWVENRLDKRGNVRLDDKNPDKSLRYKECDQIVLFKGLRYDALKKKWSGTKIYDPTRGIRANVSCEFAEDGNLRVKGTLLVISQSMIWEKLYE